MVLIVDVGVLVVRVFSFGVSGMLRVVMRLVSVFVKLCVRLVFVWV